MKFALSAMAGIALALSMVSAQAAPIKDDSKELDQATLAAIKIYRNQGSAALQKAIVDCYKQVGYATPFCVYMDTAGREIDFTVTRAYKDLGKNITPHAFFQSKAYGSRIASFYILHKQTRQQSNAHLKKIQPQIKKRVEKNLFPS